MLDAIATDLHAPLGDLPLAVAAMRMVIAAFLGSLIGIEREMHAKPAGLRTHILVALAACLFTLIAINMVAATDPADPHIRTDPLRLIQALTAGIAVLAAGAIIHSGNSVHGLTTGASMWMVGVIGLSSGAGRIALALMATVLALIVLLLMRVADTGVRHYRERKGKNPP